MNEDDIVRGPGRPRAYTDAHERARAYRAKAKLKTRNITVDVELVEALNRAADQLRSTLGFRPTISQTLHYMLKQLPNPEWKTPDK